MKVENISLKVRFDISNLELTAKGFMILSGKEKKFGVFLNKSLHWKRLTLDFNQTVIPLTLIQKQTPADTFFSVANFWEIHLPESLDQSGSITLNFEYTGKITSDSWGTNYLHSDFIEIGCYSPWYPLISMNDYPSFDLSVESPSDWIWCSNGVRKTNSNSWTQSNGDSAVTLIGIQKSLAINENASELFWGYLPSYSIYRVLEDDLNHIFMTLKKWFDPPEISDFNIVLTPRERGGTYVRKGLIVTQQQTEETLTTKKTALLRTWSHELAHLWFNHASVSTYDNWIDEALAEVTSLIISEEIFGKETYLQFCQDFENQLMASSGDLPAIKSLLRSNPKSYVVYYKWGGLILNRIKEIMGCDVFLKVLHQYALDAREKPTNQTQLFIETLSQFSKNDWSGFFTQFLENSPKKSLDVLKNFQFK